jgi:hypothetical protein
MWSMKQEFGVSQYIVKKKKKKFLKETRSILPEVRNESSASV